MKGENGVPETPDWDICHVIKVTREEFDRLMADDEPAPNENLRNAFLRSRSGIWSEDHLERGTN